MDPLAIRLRDPSQVDPGLRRGLLPSWAASIWLHALLLIAAAFGLRSCTGPGQRGEADADWRAVGLVTRPNETSSDTDAAPGELRTAESPVDVTLPTTELPPTDVTSEDVPPVPLADAPGADLPPVIGPGVGAPSFASATAEPTPASTGGTAPGPAAPSGLARGETGFFGIRDQGESFVYVLDASGSMETNHAIQAAKAELMASLARLHNGQKFQVIFYNERPTPLRLPGRAPAKLYDATDLNRTLARQVISAVQADLGTKHLPALKAALEIQPDVIYFLTDADDPALSARDLDEIRRLNPGARIHAVEFGEGPRLETSTAMERLAQQNHGAYQYVDVTKFGR